MSNESKKDLIKINNYIKYILNENKEELYTGFDKIDEKLSGLKKGKVYSFIGLPANGKTTFVLNILIKVAKKNKNVLFFNLSDSNTLLIKKIIGINNNIDVSSINYSLETQRIKDSIDQINKYNIYIDNSYEIKYIYSLCKEMYYKNCLDLVIIDGAHLISSSDFRPENKIIEKQITYGMIHKIAETFDVPVIITNQIILIKNKKKLSFNDIRKNESNIDIIFYLEKENHELIMKKINTENGYIEDEYRFTIDKKTCKINENY